MLPGYLKNYARHFNLSFKENRCYDQLGRLVLAETKDKKYVKYIDINGNWQLCKQGDLVVSIINNLQLHE